MLRKFEVVKLLVDPGVVAIIRTQKAAPAKQIAEALIASRITAMEFTMTTPNAIEAIREARQVVGDRATVGVGTVINAHMCKSAIEAGAEFVVTPICRPELVEIAHAAGCPIMIGAYTPTEAQDANDAGADFVKIFPADNLGPAYVKALRAPLPHLRIVPTGGIDVDNIGDFFKAGCVAVGVGSSLVSGKIVENSDWAELRRRAEALVTAARLARMSL